MIEVVPHGNGFIWRMICAAGRTLVEAREQFPCSDSAAAAAKDYRTRFWAYASTVDHRMAACI
jgi:hypothetical protein